MVRRDFKFECTDGSRDRVRSIRAACAIPIVLLAMSCGGDSTPTEASSSTPTTLGVLVPYLTPGDADRSQALAFDARNQPLGDVTLATSWKSLNADIVTIDSDGTV